MFTFVYTNLPNICKIFWLFFPVFFFIGGNLWFCSTIAVLILVLLLYYFITPNICWNLLDRFPQPLQRQREVWKYLQETFFTAKEMVFTKPAETDFISPMEKWLNSSQSKYLVCTQPCLLQLCILKRADNIFIHRLLAHGEPHTNMIYISQIQWLDRYFNYVLV